MPCIKVRAVEYISTQSFLYLSDFSMRYLLLFTLFAVAVSALPVCPHFFLSTVLAELTTVSKVGNIDLNMSNNLADNLKRDPSDADWPNGSRKRDPSDADWPNGSRKRDQANLQSDH